MNYTEGPISGVPELSFNLSLDRIRQFFPRFNEVAITEVDFWRAAKRAKIIVRQIPLLVPGYYKFERGRHYILINSRLTGMDFLTTALHEFCHFLFDVPTERDGRALYKSNCADDDPRERFANAFAVIGVLPMPELIRISREEDISENPVMLNLAQARIKARIDYRN